MVVFHGEYHVNTGYKKNWSFSLLYSWKSRFTRYSIGLYHPNAILMLGYEIRRALDESMAQCWPEPEFGISTWTCGGFPTIFLQPKTSIQKSPMCHHSNSHFIPLFPKNLACKKTNTHTHTLLFSTSNFKRPSKKRNTKSIFGEMDRVGSWTVSDSIDCLANFWANCLGNSWRRFKLTWMRKNIGKFFSCFSVCCFNKHWDANSFQTMANKDLFLGYDIGSPNRDRITPKGGDGYKYYVTGRERIPLHLLCGHFSSSQNFAVFQSSPFSQDSLHKKSGNFRFTKTPNSSPIGSTYIWYIYLHSSHRESTPFFFYVPSLKVSLWWKQIHLLWRQSRFIHG